MTRRHSTIVSRDISLLNEVLFPGFFHRTSSHPPTRPHRGRSEESMLVTNRIMVPRWIISALNQRLSVLLDNGCPVFLRSVKMTEIWQAAGCREKCSTRQGTQGARGNPSTLAYNPNIGINGCFVFSSYLTDECRVQLVDWVTHWDYGLNPPWTWY